jgi:hypothetical protein
MRKVFFLCTLGGLFFGATGNLGHLVQAESKSQEAFKQKYIKVYVLIDYFDSK